MKGVDVCKFSSSMVLHIKGGERSCWESCGMLKDLKAAFTSLQCLCLFLVSIHLGSQMFPALLMQRGSTKSRLLTVGNGRFPIADHAWWKKNADHCSSIFMFAFSSYWIFPVPGVSLQSPVVPGMHMPFPRKNLSSELQSHHLQTSSLASQLPLLASQVASSAVSSWADAMWTRSKLHSGPGITIETIPSSSGILLLGVIHGLTHYSDIVLTNHLEVYMVHNIYIYIYIYIIYIIYII